MATETLAKTLEFINKLASEVSPSVARAMAADFKNLTYIRVAEEHLPDIHAKSPSIARSVAEKVIGANLLQKKKRKYAESHHAGINFTKQKAAKGRRECIIALGRTPWSRYERRGLEYLANNPDHQHFGDHVADGTVDIALIVQALNHVYHNGEEVRTKSSVENKYFKIKKYMKRRLRKRKTTKEDRERILEERKEHNEIKDRLITYLAGKPSFQYRNRPNITKLTQAVNYVFHYGLPVATRSYVNNVITAQKTK